MSATETVSCPLCGGSGWKPAEGGRVTRCDCRLAGRAERLLGAARIPKRYEHCDFEGFHTELQPNESSISAAKMFAEKFVQNYPDGPTGLLFIGECGVGKTHLAVGVLRGLVLTKGATGLFYDYRELLKDIQNSYNPSVQATEMEILKPVVSTDVLVLDELGAVRPSDWVWDTVSYVLNARYNDKRTTLITTNYPDGPAGNGGALSAETRAARQPSLGDRIGDRMRSRLTEMCKKVEMHGKDLRYARSGQR